MVPTLTCCFWNMTTFRFFPPGFRGPSSNARNLLAARGTNAKTPSSQGQRGFALPRFSATYLRDDSGSSPHESDDDADGNDPERAMETEATKRTVRRD